MSRPEALGPPEVYYNEKESRKYTQNSRIIKIQKDMAARALELLSLTDEEPKLILDLGCGSGLSGEVISAAGHFWVGMDISSCMIEIAKERFDDALDDESEMNDMSGDDSTVDQSNIDDDDDEGISDDDYDLEEEQTDPDKCLSLLLNDMGEGVPFRPGTFDGCISISALQWLSHSNKSSHNPKSRLTRLFSTIFSALSRGARAIFQFYPETSGQIDLILACAMKAGFTGGLVVDYPNSSKAKKYYLCLMTGPAPLPQGLQELEESHQVGVDKRSRKRNHGPRETQKDWVLKKKEIARKRGQKVQNDSKYTARKRKIAF